MRSMRIMAVAVFAIACGGNGGEKKPADATPQATISPSPSPADTLKPAASDTAKLKADTSKAKKANGPLRDSAFGPKYTIDSTGKVTPIKKKP